MLFATRVQNLVRQSIGSQSLRSYEHSPGNVKPIRKLVRRIGAAMFGSVMASLLALNMAAAQAQDRPLKIVALGDSLTAGFGLPAGDAFPVKLATALKAKGISVEIVNAGVSGDTASGGAERLDWAVPEDTQAVILELGANDSLRGIDPKITRKAMDAMVKKLTDRHIPILICGMLAPPNLGSDYGAKFNSIFPDLAKQYGTLLYPFFLTGVVGDETLNQRDGLHPTAKGVDVIVAKILPAVEELIARAKTQRGS
jgi:acyl-CoA thioesterase-1